MESPVTDPRFLPPDCADLRRLADRPGDAILRAEAYAVAQENHEVRTRLHDLNTIEEQQQDRRGVTRRRFVVGTAATVTALATTQFVSTRASFAATPGGTLIHVFLFGGMDGLSLIEPTNAADQQVLGGVRESPLRIVTGDTLRLRPGPGAEPTFSLSQAFAPLQPYLDSSQLGFIPGVSDPRLSRSHFQATDACNLGGLPADTGGRGFLDALIDALGPGTAFRSVSIGSTLSRSLVGTNGALALSSVGSLNLRGEARFRGPTADAIRGLFTGINHPIEESVAAGLDALATAQQLAATPYAPAAGVTYTAGAPADNPRGVGRSFFELARLIKGGANVRVATIGMGGYDTHEDQGTSEGGYLFNRLRELANAMRAFFDDLGPAGADVTVMVSTEFGRRVAQNGTGCDHGHGSVVTLLSGKPLAGSLLGRWGGLQTLDNGDVPEYNNLFDVFGSVMKGRFELTDAEVARVFPSRTFTPMTLFA
jgi:uncharacterized protein (DUF1501 family)